MRRATEIFRQYLAAALLSAAALGFALPAASWAAPARGQASESLTSKTYAIPYLLVVVLVSGGVALVCRPAFRRRDVFRRRDGFHKR